MAPEPRRSGTATADVAEARRRSTRYGIDPSAREIPHVGAAGPSATALTQLSAPVLDQLLSQVADSSFGVVLADREGRLTHRDAATKATLAAMDDRSLDLGFSLAETEVGTNGVGTSLETKRPAVVVGDDHFLECFQAFTCANAPIVHPISHRLEGTVGVLCPAQDTSPLLLPTALQLSAQIRQLLLEQATPEERFLLEQFLLRRRSTRSAVATIGQGVMIATPHAQRLLAGVDHAELWEYIEVAMRRGGPMDLNIARPSSEPLRLRCRPLHRGGELEGASVELLAETHPPAGRQRIRHRESLGDLVGTSDLWQSMVREALLAAQLDESVLIVGERGTGRMSVAEAIIGRSGARSQVVFDSAEVLVEGAREWMLRAKAALSPDVVVVFRRVDQLADPVAAALASEIAARPEVRVLATSEMTSATAPGMATLLDQLNVLQIDVPPLRNRRDDIPLLVRQIAADYGRAQIDPQVVSVLYRQPWHGNVTELRQTIRSAHAKARTGRLMVQHLPRRIRQEHNRKPLHGLRQQEADAIVAAINSTSTRAEAAAQLGISRATLFRRIRAYGLDLDLP